MYYGEEIGMSENLAVEGRLAVRTPMQWTPGKHGGFSRSQTGDLVRPMVTRGKFSYKQRNVATQRADRTSLLNWQAALIRTRKECPEIGWGERKIVTADVPGVVALRYDFNGGFVLVVHNLSPDPVDCQLTMPAEDTGRLLEMFSDTDYEPLSSANPSVHLEGYGYRWLRTGDVGHDV
jgi:maltose alpha-D-glucosyltransferase / alpha-amylase